MDDLQGNDAQMHMTEAEQQMHVHYMHDQSHGMHHMNNGNVMEDDHGDGVTGVGEGIDGELHNDPGNVSDTHGEFLDTPLANGNNNQLTLSFQGQVYVFDSVSPEKICSVLWILRLLKIIRMYLWKG
ncbi:GATA transcription factor 24-like [Chenopodium quinoa]|uniref:GATA transcription factor 24-like n=1 Tax=Chenopodium quinoa TaxID=63459 RepID=UPI000B7887B3|nr:GATA transcription factor 24-like [Chenopodium quinoa]